MTTLLPNAPHDRQAAAQTEDDPVIAQTRAWLDHAVIGLGLCPFAAAPRRQGRIRYVVSDAEDDGALLQALQTELETLAAAPAEQVETTLLIHPRALNDFALYNAFLAVADMALAQLGLEGTLQIASFHPDYQFADADANDIAHATNRSPWPMLHLLREDSVELAIARHGDPDAIVERNLRTMRALGPAGWAALQRAWQPTG